MKLKIALCDDDRTALPVITGAAESAFRNQGFRTELFSYLSGKELLNALATNRFDIVLLDIDMPDLDGIEVGRRIREMKNGTQIIFVSECESRVFESFEVQPLGFVRKSNFLNDIAAVVRLYVKTCVQEQNSGYMEFETRNGLLNLRIRQIRYIEGSRNYQMLYLENSSEPTEVKMTMDKLEALTEPYGFIRIHKGYLANYRYIRRIAYDHVILRDGISLPVGRSKTAEIKNRFLSLLED